jgi:hypothetical protein
MEVSEHKANHQKVWKLVMSECHIGLPGIKLIKRQQVGDATTVNAQRVKW